MGRVTEYASLAESILDYSSSSTREFLVCGRETPGADVLFVPAADAAETGDAFASILKSARVPPLLGPISAGAVPQVFASLRETRATYLADVEGLRRQLVEHFAQTNPTAYQAYSQSRAIPSDYDPPADVVRRFSAARTAARAKMQDQAPTWLIRRWYVAQNKSTEASIQEKWARGTAEGRRDLLVKSLATREGLDQDWLDKTGRAVPALRRAFGLGGRALAVVSLTQVGYDMWQAIKDEDGRKLLRLGLEAGAGYAGGAVGAVHGPVLCAYMGVATGGVGLIACGVLGGVALGYLGTNFAWLGGELGSQLVE